MDNILLPWIEKYRPIEINEIVSHKDIINSLKGFIKMKTFPHLLFFGPSGSGKTSTILCCVKEIYGSYAPYMVLRLNASNERGIEIVRTKIKNFISSKTKFFLPKNMQDIFKLVILDEIDSMTVEAQGMLRHTIEKNSTTTRFCLICNNIDKINPALQSRCTLFRFPPLPTTDMSNKLVEICNCEKIKYEKGIIDIIIKISKGDMRFAINILQHLNLTLNKKIKVTDIYKITGNIMPDVNIKIFNILFALKNKKINLERSVNKIVDIVTKHNITIFNLLDELKNLVLNDSRLTLREKIFLIDNFAVNEIYDSISIDHKIIITIISSLFIKINQKN